MAAAPPESPAGRACGQSPRPGSVRQVLDSFLFEEAPRHDRLFQTSHVLGLRRRCWRCPPDGTSARAPSSRRNRRPPTARSIPAFASAFKWRSVGPDRGGRSIAVSGVKGRPKEAYFGAAGGGLWKTTDGGDEVGAGHRRPDHELVGRRGRRLRVEPRHRLHRHGRVVHPRQHHAGRRRLQVDRRRQDVDARRLPRLRRDLEDPHPPDQPRHRLRRRLRPLRHATATSAASSRATDGGKTLEEGAVPQRQDRRDRRRDRSQEPERDVRRAVGGVPRRVPDVERRPRQRPLQVDRRRRDVEGDHAQPRPARRA